MQRDEWHPAACGKDEVFAVVGEFSGEDAVECFARMRFGKTRCIFPDHEERAGSERGAGGEGESDALIEKQTAHIERRGARVFEFDEIVFVARDRPDGGVVVADFGDAQFGKILRVFIPRLGEGAPRFAVFDARLDSLQRTEQDGLCIPFRVRRDASAGQARIGAIEREIDRAGGVGIRERDELRGGDISAGGRDRGRVDRGIKSAIFQLLEHNRGADREIVLDELDACRVQPVLPSEQMRGAIRSRHEIEVFRRRLAIARVQREERPDRSARVIVREEGIAPPRGLADDCEIDLIHARLKPRRRFRRSEHAIAEEVLLHTIRDAEAKVRVEAQRLPDVPHVAHRVVEFAAVEIAERIVHWLFADHVVGLRVEHRQLPIVDKKAESEVALAALNCAPIILHAAARRIVARRAVVADEHVVDQVIHIHQPLVGRVARAVGIVALHTLIFRSRCEVRIRRIVQPPPGGDRAVRVVCPAECVVVFYHIVVALVSAEIVRGKRRVVPLLRVVEAPVKSVDVKMEKVAAIARLAHRDLRIAAPLIADEIVLFLPSPVPRGNLIAAQIELVANRRALRAEHWILKLRRTVIAAEKQTQRVFRVARIAARSAADSDAAIYLKTGRAVRFDQLDRSSALPLFAVLLWVIVDTALFVEETVQRHYDRNRRK